MTRAAVRTALACAAVLLAACEPDRSPQSPPAAEPVLPALTLAPGDTSGPLRSYVVVLHDSAGTIVVGSFKLSVQFDTAAFAFARLTGTDSMLVAAHASGGEVLVAGAAARGFRDGGWFAVAFTPRTAARAPAPRLTVVELGDLGGRDLRARVVAQ